MAVDAAEARLAQALQLSEKSGGDFVDTLRPTMFALSVLPQDLEAFRLAMERFHPVGFRAMAAASAEDLRHTLAGVNAPTLLVYGDNDQRAPLTVAENLHSAIKSSQLVVLKGAGHLCNVELSQQFNDVVRAFLEDLPAAVAVEAVREALGLQHPGTPFARPAWI